MEKDHAIQRLFLPRLYAVIIPIVAGLVLLGIIGNKYCVLFLIYLVLSSYMKLIINRNFKIQRLRTMVGRFSYHVALGQSHNE